MQKRKLMKELNERIEGGTKRRKDKQMEERTTVRNEEEVMKEPICVEQEGD